MDGYVATVQVCAPTRIWQCHVLIPHLPVHNSFYQEGRDALTQLVDDAERLLSAANGEPPNPADSARADALRTKCQTHLATLQRVTSALPAEEALAAAAAAAAETTEVRKLRLERDSLREEAASKNTQLKVLLDTMRQLQDDMDQFAGPETSNALPAVGSGMRVQRELQPVATVVTEEDGDADVSMTDVVTAQDRAKRARQETEDLTE